MTPIPAAGSGTTLLSRNWGNSSTAYRIAGMMSDRFTRAAHRAMINARRDSFILHLRFSCVGADDFHRKPPRAIIINFKISFFFFKEEGRGSFLTNSFVCALYCSGGRGWEIESANGDDLGRSLFFCRVDGRLGFAEAVRRGNWLLTRLISADNWLGDLSFQIRLIYRALGMKA